jgi:feruloyl esterase
VLALLAVGRGLAQSGDGAGNGAGDVACERLASDARLSGLTISASHAAEGPLQAPPGMPRSTPATVPEHCSVTAIAAPSSDSRIEIQIWLPVREKWNGKLLGIGNGGYSSNLSPLQMADALRKGYAVAGSDTGHKGDDLSFGAGHPEKIRDWAYRSTHEMAQAARRVVEVYFQKPAAHRYFEGCSTGGQQALSEAERYPGDFDGIVAGDPGYDRISLNAMFVWSWLVTHPAGEKPLPASKLPLIAEAAMKSCDAKDGIADGVIGDPVACHPDLAALRCAADDKENCLTENEQHQAEELYRGPRDAKSGKQLYPGWLPGSEMGWGAYFVGKNEPARLEFWRLWVFEDPHWDARKFEFARDREIALAKLPFVDATSTDLGDFERSGGKMIVYHGWADPVVPAQDSIEYYEAVEKRLGASTPGFFRLFLVPGMYHCSGGPGTSVFDPLKALDSWVTTNAAPDRIPASHEAGGAVVRTRPLCPFPEEARWNGKGDGNDAENFQCAAIPMR